jgi:integrase
MGSLYQRGPIWWAKYREGRKTVRVSTGTTRKDEAERFLLARAPSAVRQTGTFEELVGLVIDDYRTNGFDTIAKVQERVRLHLEPYFRGMRLTRITPTTVRPYVTQRQAEGASPATINREVAILKRGLQLAWRAELIPAIPYLPKLKERNARQGFFEEHAFRAVLQLLPAHHRPAAQFAYVTGWRMRSEVLTRQWRHIDFERGLVILDPYEAKTEDPRLFPFTPTLRGLLVAQRQGGPADCPWVFYRTDPREVSRWGYRIHDFVKAWRRACRSAGVPGMLKHDFRRTAVRNLVNAGVPERDAMLMVGWRSRQMIDRYNIRSLTDLRRAAELAEPQGTVRAQRS